MRKRQLTSRHHEKAKRESSTRALRDRLSRQLGGTYLHVCVGGIRPGEHSNRQSRGDRTLNALDSNYHYHCVCSCLWLLLFILHRGIVRTCCESFPHPGPVWGCTLPVGLAPTKQPPRDTVCGAAVDCGETSFLRASEAGDLGASPNEI